MPKTMDDGSVKPRLRLLAFASLLLAAWMYAMKPPAALSLDNLTLVRVFELKGPTHHVQGIDTDAKRLWVTSVDTPRRKGYLHEFSMMTGESLRVVEIQDAERFHPGGIASGAKSLWVPVAEYRAHSSSVIQRRSMRTLEIEFQFPVPDHIGCIAVTPEFLIGGNWDSRDFYVWNHRGELVRKIASTTSNAYQDMKFDSKYIVASGLLAGGAGAIDWLDSRSLKIVHRMTAGRTDRGAAYTREGMGIWRGQLLLLPEDEPSRLFIFRLSP
jgi:hypothetical protein